MYSGQNLVPIFLYRCKSREGWTSQIVGRGFEMRRGGRTGRKEPGRTISLFVTLLMISGAVFGLSPFISTTVTAPPPAGTLNVTFHDVVPDTQTFPGDENVTMMWIEMTASGGDVQVFTLDFTLGGTFAPGEVSSVALWDDVSGISGAHRRQEFYECELTGVASPAGSITLPAMGNLSNCVAPLGDYIVRQDSTRFIVVFVSISPTAAVGITISINLDAINADGTVIGGTGSSGTIEVLTTLFNDDMESGQGGWTTSGGDGMGQYPGSLWHLSSGEEDCINNILDQKFHHSNNTSWWYGHRYENYIVPGEFVCTYYTWVPGEPLNATRNWGNLTSPEIDGTKSQSLYMTFWHMLYGEPDTSVFKVDNGDVWIYDGLWHKVTPLMDGYDTTDASWWKETINITEFAGKQIKIEFRFDTIDLMNNLWPGWFVDDVTIYGSTVKHALAINNNDLLPYVNLEPMTISARISNIGIYNETNILVNLTDDGLVVNQTTIPWLDSGTMSVFSMGWEPMYPGVHDICFEATAASGASTESCKSTTAGFTPPKNLWIYKSGTTLMLGWEEPPFPSVQGYNIYRSTTVNGFDFLVGYDTVPYGTSQWLDPQADAGTDPNNYFYVVRAFDAQGNEDDNTDKVGKFVNQLHVGTNDISVGFELSDNTTSVVFESVDGLYEKVEAFHKVRCTWVEWTGSGGILTEVDRSIGLRVTMMAEGALITVGRVVDTVIELVDSCGGWNFVGYPSFEVTSMPEVLDDGGIAGGYDLVLGYDPTDGLIPWRFFSSDDQAGSPLVELGPGMGVWIHMTQAGLWEVGGN